MEPPFIHEELIQHIANRQGMSPDQAKSLLSEFLAYFDESKDEFIRRRHRELQDSGMANGEIYRRLSGELESRRFPAGPLSERQIRRIIYG
jgi:hypothetical protein